MQQLRDPKSGCEWDKKQNFQSLTIFTLEEAYEVVDAIEREDYESLKEELGDLLLQVVFYSQIALEKDLFSFKEVTESISNKLIDSLILEYVLKETDIYIYIYIYILRG